MENGAKVLRHEMPVKMHCTQFDMITVIELAKEFDFEFTLDHAWGASDYMEPIVESGCPVIFGPIAVAKGFGESIKIDIDSVVEMDKRGVLCSIMTDGPVYHPWLIVEQAGEVVRYGADVERAIAMLTINRQRRSAVISELARWKSAKTRISLCLTECRALDPAAGVVMTLVDGEIAYQSKGF